MSKLLGEADSRVLRDSVSPHKVALLQLVLEYCVSAANARDRIVLPGDEDTYTEREERDFMFLLLQLLQIADMELKELVAMLQKVAKPKLMDKVLERLEELSEEGVRSIMDLFQTLQESLFQDPAPLLNKTSVLGLFVRRMILAFEKLSFSQVRNLHTRYRLYYECWQCTRSGQAHSRVNLDGRVSMGGCRVSMGGDDMSMMDDASMSILDMLPGDNADDTVDHEATTTAASGGEVGRYSQRQAEFFIAQQASLLQYNEQGCLAPQHLQQKINELLSSNPHLAEAHFLSYLNYLRVGEYCGAVDSLYHYFDRHTAAALETPPAGAANRSRQEEDPSCRGLRYAALTMAALHHHFKHKDEALKAVQEAIRMAQEANDHVCLQHALGWLQRLGVQGTGTSAYMLDRLVSKSSELNLAYLMSMGVQVFAKHNALASAQPSSIFEYLLKSDIINCQSSMSDLMSTSYAHKAALWNLYGKSEMSSLSSQLMLHLNTQQQGVYHSGEAECLALCHLAQIHADQGHYSLAHNLLASARQRFPSDSQHGSIWILCEQRIQFTRALRQGKLSLAQTAVNSIAAINAQEAAYCRILLDKERGNISQAQQAAVALLTECNTRTEDGEDSTQLACRVLCVQGELHCSVGNPTDAGGPLLSALTMAKSHNFTYLITLATLHIAHMQMYLDLPRRALCLIEGVMLSVLTDCGVHDKARAHCLYVKCKIAAVKNKPDEERKEELTKCISILEDALAWFRQSEAHFRVKDTLYYMAHLYHEVDNMTERNKCALQFKLLDLENPTHSPTAIAVL